MCRLYGLQATHPTRSACELLDAQNAMIQQSRKDARGLSNPHGWGMGQVTDGTTSCFRQVKPASESKSYRDEALQTEGTTVLAHVRRATVGDPSHANTHPFRHGPALLIHNGHVPAFDAVRPHLLGRLSDERARYVRGTTDSEHVLALLLQLRDESPSAPLHAVTRAAPQQVQSWVAAEAPDAEPAPTDADTQALSHDELEHILALNLLWTDGTTLAGSRLNRTLWTLDRPAVRACPLCGDDHASPPADADYHATAVASERITDEDWTEVPNGSVFSTSDNATLHLESLTST
ncbi:glutamine amidotransferase [Salinibacter ruber]|uniref:class II glutamine amidotransferase n=1 Tax=Salinibacter ruber TaxID=146919 RepID=UPI002169675C|nr:class II glutamine amidotransferase [Salinibacter ruber]MCS3750836.1 glutamine amidotransferase [Salinibacter ruber]